MNAANHKAKKPLADDTPGREIVITRTLDSPRELVFRAWTDPGQIARWWEPKGLRTVIDGMDVRPGGVCRFVIYGPDGIVDQHKIVYMEVQKPERLVYSHVAGSPLQMTVTFCEQGDKTRLTVQMLFESVAAREKVIEEFGAVGGLNQMLERLRVHLAKRIEKRSGLVHEAIGLLSLLSTSIT